MDQDNNAVNTNTENMEKITWFGYQSFILCLVRALSITVGTYIMFTISQIDTHISTILGFIIALIPFCIFLTISKNKYELDIINLNVKLFGKVIGNILNIILNIVFLFLGTLLLYNISQYINIQYIPNTPSLYVKILIIMPVIYAATKSISTITRISQVVLFINLTLFVLSITGLIEEFNFSNLLPVFEQDISSIIYSALIFAVSISAPLFLMTIIPQNRVVKKKYSKKKMLVFFSISVLVLIIIVVTTILILGIDIINIYRYPVFMALRKFSMFTIIERVERFLSLQFIIDVIMYLILTFHFITTTLNRSVKLKQHKNILEYAVGIVLLLITTYLFKDSVRTDKIVNDIYIYVLSFGILLPMFITCIGLVIDNIKGKLKQFNSSNSIQP